MFAVVFSYTFKSDISSRNSKYKIYTNIIKIKLINVKNFVKLIEMNLCSDKHLHKNNLLYNNRPISIKAFMKLEDLRKYIRLIPAIKLKLKSIKTNNKYYNICINSKYEEIVFIRRIKATEEEDNIPFQKHELDKTLLEVCQKFNIIINNMINTSSEARAKEYKYLRHSDKIINKHIST
jgi:hypothetical protein